MAQKIEGYGINGLRDKTGTIITDFIEIQIGSINGLRDKTGTGRPTSMPKRKPARIQLQIAEGQLGRSARQAMNPIYERSGAEYHGAHAYRLLRKRGSVPKAAQREIRKFCHIRRETPA